MNPYLSKDLGPDDYFGKYLNSKELQDKLNSYRKKNAPTMVNLGYKSRRDRRDSGAGLLEDPLQVLRVAKNPILPSLWEESKTLGVFCRAL